jgi:hypothetical protein
MPAYSLQLRSNLMFLEHNGLWLIDTGSPFSVSSRVETICLDGIECPLRRRLPGFAIEDLTEIIGFEATGLLGGDILNRFDWIFDLPNQTITVTAGELDLPGARLPLEGFFSVPAISATVRGELIRALLDSGAELSYFPPRLLEGCAIGEQFRDFNPYLGWFDVDLHEVSAQIGNSQFILRSGAVRDEIQILAMTLQLAGASGLIGNQIFHDRRVGYFPRRGTLILDGSNGHAAA